MMAVFNPSLAPETAAFGLLPTAETNFENSNGTLFRNGIQRRFFSSSTLPI